MAILFFMKLAAMTIIIMVLHRCQHLHQDLAPEHCTKRVRLYFSNADMVMIGFTLAVVMIMVMMALMMQLRSAQDSDKHFIFYQRNARRQWIQYKSRGMIMTA